MANEPKLNRSGWKSSPDKTEMARRPNAPHVHRSPATRDEVGCPSTRSPEYYNTRNRPVHRTLSVVPSKKLAGIPFVCECLHCMATMTKEATVSVRLTAREKSGLDADARMKGIPSGTAAAGYIAEGVRRSRFPAIEFRDGQPGRVAYLVGSRWPIWMIVELVRELDGDLTEAVKLIRKPAALVRMALAYADAYPQEIKDSAALASRRDYAGMKQEIPELEQL
jgi:hypothetical protein